MALADVQTIVNSYMQGVQNKLAQQRQAQEKVYQDAVVKNQQADIDQRKAELQQNHEHFTLSLKAAQAIQEAQHQISLQHIQETGQTPVGSTLLDTSSPGDESDSNTPSYNRYDIPDPFSPTGRSTTTLQTPLSVAQQAANVDTIARKPEEDRKIREQQALQTAETARQLALAEKNNTFQKELEGMRTTSAEAIARLGRTSAEGIAAQNRTSARETSLINQGFIPPTMAGTGGTGGAGGGGTGGDVDIAASGVPEILNSLRTGQHTAADMGQYQGPGKMAMRTFAKEGGIPINQKQSDNLKGIANVINLLPEYQRIVDSLPDTNNVFTAGVENRFQNISNPELVNNLNMLNSQALTAGRSIAGESGKPTNLQTQLVSGGMFPKLDGTPKKQQQERLDNLHKTAINEAKTTLSNIPEPYKSMMMNQYGLLGRDLVKQDGVPEGLADLVPEGQSVFGPNGDKFTKTKGKLVKQ